MNDYGIPIIEPTIDLTQVPAIHQKRTITFVNHFIIHTVTFLNKFALCCEEKLFEFENKLQKVEASLEILESRLSSIPEADSPAPPDTVKTDSVKHEEEVTKENVPEVVDVIQTEHIEEKIEDSNMQPISKDPRYAKFFKLVKVRVPVHAVKLKMKQEGLDPDILDNPDKMVPITEVADTNTTTGEDNAQT